MNKIRLTISALIVLAFLMPLFSAGQNNTSSPYSKFGIGDLSSVGYGRNLALGGAGLGVRDPYLLNLKNPASLTAIDSMNFLFEMGVNGQFTQASSVGRDEYYWDGNLSHITMGHRYTNWLMGSYGLMPYTNIGYHIRTSASLEGDEGSVITDWEGSGGISKLFYSLGLKISKNFSLGGEVAYYYGPVTELRRTRASVQPLNPTIYYSNTRYQGFSYKGGFQFSANLDKSGTALNIGATFSPGQKLWGKSEILIEQQYGSSAVDSMYYNEKKATSIYMPMNYGAGLSFVWKGKYLLAADYEQANWDDVNNDKSYTNQTIYSFGLERLPQNKLKYSERCAFRAGFRYDSGYLNTKGYQIDDMRFSLGVGLPIQKTGSMVNVTLEAGQRGTTQMGLIRERYTKMTVAFSFQDFWFIKRKVN
jgi:hypothetical protein